MLTALLKINTTKLASRRLRRAACDWRSPCRPTGRPACRNGRSNSFAEATRMSTLIDESVSSSHKSRQAIPRRTLASAVAERLRERILRGEFREGEQLRQHAIADEFA